jgi:ferritin-like metal-binding protein YciE
MGETKMKLNLLRKLYVDELKDLYSAENQLIKALPKMAKATDSEELRTAFEEHLKQTQEHASRLEKIFAALEESPKGKKCKGMEGLIEEGSEMIEEGLEPAELDAGLIAAAQRVEHYEIAGYGCVRTYANLLGETSAVSLLEKTLAEEKAADEKLTEISEQINAIAAEAEERKPGSSGRKTKPGDTARAARV